MTHPPRFEDEYAIVVGLANFVYHTRYFLRAYFRPPTDTRLRAKTVCLDTLARRMMDFCFHK